MITGRAMITGQANAPVAYQQDSAGPTLSDRAPRGSREFPIGFESSTGIAAGGAATVEVKPQVYYRGERLAVAASIAAGFDLTDIKVGKDSQLAASGNLPCECFSNVSVGVRMMLDTAEPGIVIDLLVVNTTAASTLTFKAVLYGTVID
jgi:hypothetical protein